VHEYDSPQKHLEEIMSLSSGTADENLARILTHDVANRISNLESYGIKFKKNANGSYLSVKPCFAQTERSVSVRGMEDIRAIFEAQVKKRNMEVLENCTILGLFCSNSVCYGAYGINSGQELIQISAKSTIIAAGGGISLFTDNYSVGDLTGDGYSMALDAGAALTNLEFIQFIPATSRPQQGRPFEQRALGYLDFDKSGDIIGKIGSLSCDSAESVLADRSTHGPFSTRDCGKYFDEALFGGSFTGRLYFKREIDESKNWVARSFAQRMSDYGIDIFDEGITLALFAQAFNGGILIDENAATSVRGLFACGEAAGGMHGADRMGGCAMASTQVFGKIAGESAAKYAGQSASPPSFNAKSEFIRLINGASAADFDLTQLKLAIKEAISTACSCVRNAEKCSKSLVLLSDIERKSLSAAKYALQDQNFISIKKAVECYHMINSGKSLIMMILARAESIGPHYRTDCTSYKDSHRMHIVRKKNGEMAVSAL
jgi:L-aspartate oxidase